MICPKCKAENPDGAEFCTLCYCKFTGHSIGLNNDDIYAEIAEKHKEAKILCPNCEDVSPISAMWCIKCGFIFEDREGLIITDERAAELLQEKQQSSVLEIKGSQSEPIVISADSDGVAALRSMQEVLRSGNCPRVEARGRNAITYAIKLITLLGEEMRKNNRDLLVRTFLATEEQLVHPDDLAVTLLLETAQ